MEIINLTQHAATPEQVAAGVVEPPAEVKEEIRRLLTFNELPSQGEVRERAANIAELALRLGAKAVLIGGAPYLMGPLEKMLIYRGIAPLYSFSRREVTEEVMPDGSVRKVSTFRHMGFVPSAMRVYGPEKELWIDVNPESWKVEKWR